MTQGESPVPHTTDQRLQGQFLQFEYMYGFLKSERFRHCETDLIYRELSNDVIGYLFRVLSGYSNLSGSTQCDDLREATTREAGAR